MDNYTEKTIEETIHKAQDWWATHNFGTRITLMTFLLLTFLIVLIPFMFPTMYTDVKGVNTEVARVIPHYALILTASIEATLWAFIIVTVGPNTIGKIAEAWVKYKGAK